jgi:hypothetical protein
MTCGAPASEVSVVLIVLVDAVFVLSIFLRIVRAFQRKATYFGSNKSTPKTNPNKKKMDNKTQSGKELSSKKGMENGTLAVFCVAKTTKMVSMIIRKSQVMYFIIFLIKPKKDSAL